jgi:O-antigen/teichoic acid export membrane protein
MGMPASEGSRLTVKRRAICEVIVISLVLGLASPAAASQGIAAHSNARASWNADTLTPTYTPPAMLLPAAPVARPGQQLASRARAGSKHRRSGTMVGLIAAVVGGSLLVLIVPAAFGRRRRARMRGVALAEPASATSRAWPSGRRWGIRSGPGPAPASLFETTPSSTAPAAQRPVPPPNPLTAHPSTASRPGVPAPIHGRPGLRHAQPLRAAAATPASTEHPAQQVGARRTTVDILVQVVGRIGNLALGVAVTLVLVHWLGARGFGQWSTILAITQIAVNFGDLGLSQVTIVRAVAEREREHAWLGALVSLRMALAVPVTLGALVGVLAIVPAGDARVAGVLLAATLLVGAPGALSAVFQLRVRNDVSTAILTVNSVLWLAGVIVVSAAGGGIRAFAAVFLAINALTTALTVTLGARWGRPQLAGAWRLWRPLLRVGLGVGAAGILVTMYVKLDQILVFEFAGSRQAGLYGAAYRILDQAQFIPISVMTTLFPLIAASYSTDAARARRLLQRTAEYLSMGSLGALAFTIVAARPIMVALFGRQFAAAAPALPVLMGAFVSISFGYLVGNMVVILELQRRFLRYAALALVLNVVLNVILIPPYGFEAAAWVTLATEVTVMSLTARCVLRRLQMKPSWTRLGRVAVAAGGMGLAVGTARQAGLPLSALVAIAAVLYPALLLASRALTPCDVAASIRREPIA